MSLVVAIAPGGYIYSKTCAQVIHYRAKLYRDFVPRLDVKGASREKSTIIDLVSDPNAAPFDHEFMSPTYRYYLFVRIRNYINSKGKKI